MKVLEVEFEQLRLLVVAMEGREQVGCVRGSGGGTVDDKVGEVDERDARESSLQPGRRLRGGKVTCRRETGHKETRMKEMGRKTNGSKEMGVGETVAKETGGEEKLVKAMGMRDTGGKVSVGKAMGAQVSQETGGKGDRLMIERESLITFCHQVTECDVGNPSEELFRGSDRGGEKESEGVCGGLNS